MRTTTATKTSTLTKTIVGVAVLASAGAIAAAVLSTKATPTSTITPSVDISVTIEKADDTAMDIRSDDNKAVSVLLKNNSLKTAKNVSVTLEYDANFIIYNTIPPTSGSGAGVKSYGCTETYPDEEALFSGGEEVGTVTCTYDIPAGQEAELFKRFKVNDIFANCGSESETSSLIIDPSMKATATYVNDPALPNNTDREVLDIVPFECPEISVDISLEDDSVMTYNDSDREATISVTNHDDILGAYYLPINVFASGGLFLENVDIEQVRGDDVSEDGNYLYYDFQTNYVDQTFTPVQIGPGVTETYKVPYHVSQYAVECGTSAEAMIHAGIASYLESDLSDDTVATTVMIEGVDCE